MNRKKLLFIVPSRSNAGVNSSLSSLYNSMKGDYDISVLSLTRNGNGTYEFLSRTFSLACLSSYYGDYSSLHIREKIISIVLKGLKHLSAFMHNNWDKQILYNSVRRFESRQDYDNIVAFQEGQSTEVGSWFKNPNKIAWIHCDIERVGKSNEAENKIYSCYKKIVCVSKFTRNKFIARYPLLEDKTEFIYNLVDAQRVSSLKDMPIDDMRFKTYSFTIVSAGRMDPVKQFILIPQIAAKLKDLNCQFEWYILGGPENEEYNKVLLAIKQNDVEDCVFLLGNKTNPYPYFKNADLYVSTSWSEACPMVFIEAQICGIPIVTNSFGSSFEFVQNDKNGYIDTIENLWQPIAKLITDNQTYSRIKAGCDTYNIDNSAIMSQLNKLFS